MFSGLSTIFSSITFYIILGLSIATASFGYISYTLSDDLAVAKQSLKEQENVVLSLQKAAKQQEISCKINDDSVAEVENQKKDLQDKLDAVTDQISKLTSGIQKPVNTKETSNVEKQNDFLAGTELLSPALQRLLNAAYCISEPTDQICLSPTKPAD